MATDRSARGAAAAALATLLLIACGEEPPPAAEPVRPIKMLQVSASTGGEREYPGRIKAGQYSEMGFEVPGRVTEFVYKEGAAVEKDAVLARIDPSDYQARYDSAVAKMKHAQAERDRYKSMYEKDVKPYAEYEMRVRAYEVQQAAVREAKKALDDTILRAPFDGVMARKLVEEFENVLAKQPVLVMQNDDLLEIKVSVPERDLASGRSERLSDEQITAILRPRVVVSALPDRQFPAELKELANVADPTTRTFEATFLFENPGGVNILGGMTAKVIIDVPADRVEGGVLVPALAVAGADGGGSYVWAVDTDSMQVSRRAVTVGDMTGADILVTSGLEPGDTIAISGVHQLREGQTVRPFER